MNPLWVSLFGISRGVSLIDVIWLLTFVCWKYTGTWSNCDFSSSLPDYVFDEGERQPKQTLKRPKTNKVMYCNIS